MHKEFKKTTFGSLELLKPVLSEWQELMTPSFWNYQNHAPWCHVFSDAKIRGKYGRSERTGAGKN